MKPVFFANPDEMRTVLEAQQEENELWVGFYKRGCGRPSITWPESVDVALCYGWIDGLRKSIDDVRYMIRFTPRRPNSVWSAINMRRVAELKKAGRMKPAGLEAFAQRSGKKSQIYSYEQRDQASFDKASEKRFRTNRAAWKFFQSQAPWYKRTSTYWVMTAKKEETRQSRLARLIACSADGLTLPQLTRKK